MNRINPLNWAALPLGKKTSLILSNANDKHANAKQCLFKVKLMIRIANAKQFWNPKERQGSITMYQF